MQSLPPVSRALEVIAAPILKDVSSEWSCEAVRQVFTLAALAWNLTLDSSERLTAACESLPKDFQQDIRSMMARKQLLYKADRRYVLGVRTVRTASGFDTEAMWASAA